MNEEQLDTIENNVDDLPQEVKDFIFGEGVTAAKEEINKNLDTEEQKLTLSNELMAFLLEGIDERALTNFIDGLTIADDKKAAIKAIIQDRVIDELVATIEAEEELEKEAASKSVITHVTAPAPIAASPLASLADRLKQNSIATPMKRDLSNEKASETTSEPHAIDPYHEPIDNI